MSIATVEAAAGDAHALNGTPDQSIAIFRRTGHATVVRSSLGLLLAAGSLLLPWLGLTLTPSLSPWRLDLSLGAVPSLDHLDYGVIGAALTLGATVSFIRSRGMATWTTRAIGWMFLLLPVVFLATTRLVGTAAMFTLQSDANQTQIINSQFLTNNNIPPPSQFLGISFDAKSLLLLYGLRLGWYLMIAAGVLLAGRVGRPRTAWQWSVFSGAGVAVLTVVVGLGLGSVAQSDVDDGIQAVATGRPASGEQFLASALRLNPGVAYDAGYQQALGQAQGDQGRQTALAYYAEAARPVGKDLTLLEKARLFGESIAQLPPDSPAATVVNADLATFLATATITSANPNLLFLVNRQVQSPAVTFSVGRYYYEAGANSQAISMLGRTGRETSNSEVRSLALTYVALAWLRLGNEANFRTSIVAAVRDDTLNENVYAREISAGLYVPGTP